jgi:hypothetical protein
MAGLAVLYGIVRSASAEAARVNVVTDDQRGLILLDLGIPPRSRFARRRGPLLRPNLPPEVPGA